MHRPDAIQRPDDGGLPHRLRGHQGSLEPEFLGRFVLDRPGNTRLPCQFGRHTSERSEAAVGVILQSGLLEEKTHDPVRDVDEAPDRHGPCVPPFTGPEARNAGHLCASPRVHS